jgi:hypothetical protein
MASNAILCDWELLAREALAKRSMSNASSADAVKLLRTAAETKEPVCIQDPVSIWSCSISEIAVSQLTRLLQLLSQLLSLP